MKSQRKKLGFGMVLVVLPFMATTVSAQWTQQRQATGVVVNIGDSVVEPTVAPPIITKSVHTVALAQNGTLTGQIALIDPGTKSAAGLKGLSVFFVQNGQVIKQAKTRADGSFEIQGLDEGAYSFFAAGNAGFAASGVYITRRNWGDANDSLEATIASSNYSGIQQMVQRIVPAEVRQAIISSNPIESKGFAVQSQNQVRLINGQLNGQINSLFGDRQTVSGVQVHLIQNDKPIAQVETNAQGEFSIPDVEPGVYDLVAASQTAMVVGRFDAIGNSGPMTQVSFRKVGTKLEYALTETREWESQEGQDEITYQDATNAWMESSQGAIEYAGESVCYGGAGGGSAGNVQGGIFNGRFGGGGAGMGRLLRIGAFGAGITAIAIDNPSPASPVK